MSSADRSQAMPHGLADLIHTIDKLRAECPWNASRSLDDLADALVEEAVELRVAVTSRSVRAIRDEAGDVLFNLLSALMVSDVDGSTTLDSVASEVSRRMQSRHPYVFGDETDPGPAEAERLWAEAKRREEDERMRTLAGHLVVGTLDVPHGDLRNQVEIASVALLQALGVEPVDVGIDVNESGYGISLTARSGSAFVLVSGIEEPVYAVLHGFVRGAPPPTGWLSRLNAEIGPSAKINVLLIEVHRP